MSEAMNISDIINLVKESNKEFESDIFIPSLKKEIHFKPMNASHLKSIIKTSVEGIFSNNLFNQSVFSIIKEIIDPSVNISQITLIDKIYILLQLREKNVKNLISVEVTNDDKSKKIDVKLDKLINKIKKQKISFEDEKIIEGSYEIIIGFPTLDQEFLFDKHFEQTRIKKTDQNNQNAIKELFAPLFMNEISQYIKSIKIKEQEVNLLTLPVSERISIIESFSISIISQLIEKIDSSFGKQINKIISIEEEIDGEKYSGKIELNAGLFT